ncbi:MAG: hypothetical protein KJ622_12420 [Alphaproteobacteria bacterium]|nr:hypothetical protein [Alphaproteobacteria bacterium]
MKKVIFTLAAIATAAFAAAPANAGGKKLHFGGPLGSFVASPHSGGSTHSSNNRTHASKKAAHRRAASKKAAARQAAAQKLAAQKAAVRNAQQKVAAAKVETTKETASDWKAPVKASAIAGTNTLNFRRNAEPANAELEVAKIETTDTAELQPESTEVAELECKRYIASAGMTVTVPCGR